ncbi:Retrovirus-related Pol polyprotein from transposon TNT 1-94 [Trichinella pseudospiralis]|uniref:Retrovirus-related Pol polyprotein from transposon TNT 1-94 n=1 Tax=Trichinella pseudospiralis TaxID=6337 RepID=A0A0V1GJU9_TRIPS|nr:Retrovirus-related Pol polyprotein from transposon TNT 1-94 [Trichinella pseudospiralis]
MQVASVGGARYFLSFIDDFSRKSFVYFLKHNNEALPKFKDFIAMVERQTSKRVKKGIRHERTIPETPQQNGVAERMNACEKGQNDADRCQLEPGFVGRGCGHSQLPKKQMFHKGSAKGDSRRSLVWT